jgi:hypothetical protein
MSTVPLEFRHLVSTDDLQGDVVEVDRSVSKVIPTTADPLHPVEEFFAKAENDKFNIPKIAPQEAPHKDGVTIEKSVGGTFHYHYAGGRLTKTEVFSDDGKHEVIEEPVPEVIIETSLAKIIGVREEDQIEIEVGE